MTLTHTLPLTDAIAGFTAVLPHASKDDVTPVITTVKLTHDYLIATDRHTIGKWDIARGSEESPHHVPEPVTESVLVPREAAEWVTKIVTSKLRHAKSRAGNEIALYSLHVSQELLPPSFDGGDPLLGDLTLSIVFDGKIERSQSFDTVGGNFPPLERLVDGWKPAINAYTVGLNPEYLERVTTFAKRHEKERPVRFELGEESSGKPSPIRATFGQLTAIIQPNLLTK